MKPSFALFACLICISGCGKKESAPAQSATARESTPLIQSTTAETAPPPPPPTSVPPPVAATSAGTAPEPDAPRKVELSVYENISPAQRAAADKDKLFRDWALAFRSGTGDQKAKAKAAVAKLPAGDRAAFEAFCKQYGVKIQ